jgi:hypothetical protein
MPLPTSRSPERCPICDGRELDPRAVLPGLRVTRCRACGHRAAIHDGAHDASHDYHEQYDGGPFLDALRATRARQASRLIDRLQRHVPHLSALVDYGAGRGWFLEACRSAGVAPLAGVDTSPLAVAGLKASGIEALLLDGAEAAAGALARLSFRPRVVSLLDVIEHFPTERLPSRLRGIVSACGRDLELVVVKVPVAGLLHAGATALSRAGIAGPLRQLYQCGTWPPHFSYFSPASAERLLATAGLTVVERFGDRDFEPAWLGQRIGVRHVAGRALVRVGGATLAAAVRITGTFDSALFFARPTTAGRPQAP